jgi:hypothetical protein
MKRSVLRFFQIPHRSLLAHRNRLLFEASNRPFNDMVSMKAANTLKIALDEGKAASHGCWQMIPGANVSRTLARTGVDWVLVDCEHGNIDGQLLGFSFVIVLLILEYLTSLLFILHSNEKSLSLTGDGFFVKQ